PHTHSSTGSRRNDGPRLFPVRPARTSWHRPTNERILAPEAVASIGLGDAIFTEEREIRDIRMRTREEAPAHATPAGVPRRDVLRGSLVVGAALAAPMVFIRRATAEERVLKIVHWKHPVPDYDRWFDGFARDFGTRHHCQVEVDNVVTDDLPTAIAADVSRAGGHDIFHLNGTGAWLYDRVLVDVTDVASRLGQELGGWITEAASVAAVNGKWLCIPQWFIR